MVEAFNNVVENQINYEESKKAILETTIRSIKGSAEFKKFEKLLELSTTAKIATTAYSSAAYMASSASYAATSVLNYFQPSKEKVIADFANRLQDLTKHLKESLSALHIGKENLGILLASHIDTGKELGIHNIFEYYFNFEFTPEDGFTLTAPIPMTPLMLAAFYNNTNAIDLILEKEINPNQEQSGITALHMAAIKNNKETVIKLLTQTDMNKDAPAGKEMVSPLALGCYFGSLGVVEALLKADAIIEQNLPTQHTLLHLTARSPSPNKYAMLKYLIDNTDLSLAALDLDNNTPFVYLSEGLKDPAYSEEFFELINPSITKRLENLGRNINASNINELKATIEISHELQLLNSYSEMLTNVFMFSLHNNDFEYATLLLQRYDFNYNKTAESSHALKELFNVVLKSNYRNKSDLAYAMIKKFDIIDTKTTTEKK